MYGFLQLLELKCSVIFRGIHVLSEVSTEVRAVRTLFNVGVCKQSQVGSE